MPVWWVQGYGTVRFSSKEDAEKAIADFHGTDLESRALAVKLDKCATTPACIGENRVRSASAPLSWGPCQLVHPRNQ